MKDRHKKIKKRQTYRIDLKGENEESCKYLIHVSLDLMIQYVHCANH
jgi:hypothetical protein